MKKGRRKAAGALGETNGSGAKVANGKEGERMRLEGAEGEEEEEDRTVKIPYIVTEKLDGWSIDAV